ncbi:MAG: hypothetical protein IJB55_07015 [Firmicutes bacterium]|nr:hypothetical protein [Bacillota bacterium]
MKPRRLLAMAMTLVVSWGVAIPAWAIEDTTNDFEQVMPSDVIAALTLQKMRNDVDIPGMGNISNAENDLLAGIALPASLNIDTINIDMDKIHQTYPLTDDQKHQLKVHGYTDEEIAELDMGDFFNIEATWPIDPGIYSAIKFLYPELADVDITQWTNADWQAYYTAEDAKKYAPTAEEAQALAERNITLDDARNLLKNYYDYETILAQSDEQLAEDIEAYYQFTIDNINEMVKYEDTATNAWNILRQRSWAKLQNGSGVKPMMNTAKTFHANLLQSNNQHYALSAAKSVFITSIGYTTIQKVNYALSGGQYSVSSFVFTNDGDGTVPAASAQNGSSSPNAQVIRITNSGNHTDMVSNPDALARVYIYVSQALAGYSSSAIDEKDAGNIYVNEKGWVVGEGIDGRRVRVIIRGSNMPTVISSTGESCTLIGEQLYIGDEANEDNYVGECLEVSDGYQFELMRDAYKFVYDDDDEEGISVEVSYMENGYYETMQTYEIKETEGTYELNTGESVQELPKMTVRDGVVVEPSAIFNYTEIQRLNVE